MTRSPLWPNPAPNGPIRRTHRLETCRNSPGANVFTIDNTNTTITIMDGEPLTDVLNRIYALAFARGMEYREEP